MMQRMIAMGSGGGASAEWFYDGDSVTFTYDTTVNFNVGDNCLFFMKSTNSDVICVEIASGTATKVYTNRTGYFPISYSSGVLSIQNDYGANANSMTVYCYGTA